MSIIGPWYSDQTYENGVLSAAFDEANARLNVTVVSASTVQDVIGNDENFVWSSVYDPTSRTIRVIEV